MLNISMRSFQENPVPHVHMHIIPRYPGTPKEFWAPFAVYDAPNARMGDESEVVSLCERIKSLFRDECI